MPTLLDQIGDSQTLHRILTDFYHQLKSDLMVGFLFRSVDLETLVNQQHAFLLKAFGATQNYSGKSPSEAHKHLPILPGHFDRRLIILKNVLNAHHISQSTQEKWIAIENSFRTAILSNKDHS